jgi:hypothetical protein
MATTDSQNQLPLGELSPNHGLQEEETLVTDSDEDEPWTSRILQLPGSLKRKIPRKVKEQRLVVKAQQDILKFNRMGTHLANERTLLAWVCHSLKCTHST